MKTPNLDVSPWNLGIPLLVLAACGRTLPLLPGEESDSDPEATTTDDPQPEPTDTSVDPSPPECQNSNDCQPGYYCYDGDCIGYSNDDDYCSDGDCCWDGCCYDGCYYYECYSDYDCNDGEVCVGYTCEPGPDGPPICPQIPVSYTNPEAALDYVGGISLAFVDTPTPGREVAVADAQGLQVFGVQGITVVAELETLSMDVADIDADGDEDIVVLSATALHAFPFDAMAGFVAGPVTPIEAIEGGRLTLADFDGNGATDAFVGTQDWTVRFEGAGDGTFLGPGLLAGPTCALIGVPSASFEATDDLMYGESGQAWYAFGSPMIELVPYGLGGKGASGESCPLGTGDFDADGLADAVMLDAGGNGALTTWRAVANLGGGDVWYPPVFHQLAAVADLDADGYDDVVLAGATTDATLRFGIGKDESDGPLGCYDVIPLGFAPQVLAIGDLDGDGHEDIVGADGATVWVVLATK